MFSTGFTSFSVFFFLIRSPFLSYIDEALSINLSANVFVFGVFNVHHKDFLICSVATDRPGELCCNFSTLLR